MLISIIIPTLNEEANLPVTLRQLAERTDVELIVINNDRLDWLLENRPQVAKEVVRRLSEWVVRTDRERALSNR